jgi:hypothetical protein
LKRLTPEFNPSKANVIGPGTGVVATFLSVTDCTYLWVPILYRNPLRVILIKPSAEAAHVAVQDSLE